jgi:hypothetical protein
MISIANGDKQNQISRSSKITCGDDDRTQQEDQEDNKVRSVGACTVFREDIATILGQIYE